jgi:3-phenylpropionate/trans-cinnamate dioxygenase ferredoxin component
MLPPIRSRAPAVAAGPRLIAVAELPPGGVAEVETEEHGTLAVGLAAGEAFAVSNVCRHQFAKLGRGQVTADGCLECPWHRARYDVRTGEMTSGPKGRIFGFPPYSRGVQGFANTAWRIRTFPVEVRDGVIWLA